MELGRNEHRNLLVITGNNYWLWWWMKEREKGLWVSFGTPSLLINDPIYPVHKYRNGL